MNKILAVDFDGTLCRDRYPNIGEPNFTVINYLKLRKMQGWSIILWTCRTADLLDQAVHWCEQYDLTFDAINENLPQMIELYGGDTRKVFADEYLDDKNIPLPRSRHYQYNSIYG